MDVVGQELRSRTSGMLHTVCIHHCSTYAARGQLSPRPPCAGSVYRRTLCSRSQSSEECFSAPPALLPMAATPHSAPGSRSRYKEQSRAEVGEFARSYYKEHAPSPALGCAARTPNERRNAGANTARSWAGSGWCASTSRVWRLCGDAGRRGDVMRPVRWGGVRWSPGRTPLVWSGLRLRLRLRLRVPVSAPSARGPSSPVPVYRCTLDLDVGGAGAGAGGKEAGSRKQDGGRRGSPSESEWESEMGQLDLTGVARTAQRDV
ncbi:hypothetical protein CALCODRAFT_79574 [Calocera cornea HHB12733]|uniref:Uncharacterized protein n=1 Tax=Calocera cornea HHB12733 TaxID=1353952 RepID=A0A165DFE3_9BASI|nr:hypothetical protein CALCODRAFT_79574 [Calocera cornea HHB12733]